MGLELYGNAPDDWGKLAIQTATNSAETMRRSLARRRICLFRDDFETVLQEQLGIIFRDEAVRLRFYRLARLAGASSFLKRISDEVARPLYSTPPVRRVFTPGEKPTDRDRTPSDAQSKYNALAKAVDLNATMDLVARLIVACSPVFIVGRVLEGIGPTLDVVTSDCVSVIPDPRKRTRALAIVYDRGGGMYSVVDDQVVFDVNANGLASSPRPHNLGRMPVVEVHRRGRWGSYWDTQGQDLEVAALQLMFIDAILLKKHKSQSHIQLAFSGDSDGLVKSQVLDEESVLMVNGQGSLIPIDLQGDPSGLLQTKQDLRDQVAAAYGISRARLNQDKEASDAGLNERTAEIMQVMGAAESDTFDLLQKLSKSTADAIPDGLEIAADYRAMSSRMEPMDELAYWKELRANGLRSIVDDAFALNPELATEEQAWAEIDANMADEAVYIQRRRALNISPDDNMENPGQTPEQNGAMGPAVKSGEMSKDEAAANAKQGAKPTPASADDVEAFVKSYRGKK